MKERGDSSSFYNRHPEGEGKTQSKGRKKAEASWRDERLGDRGEGRPREKREVSNRE